MSETKDPYDAGAIFQCSECGSKFRRDQCRTRKGQLECPRCLPTGICGTLRYCAAIRSSPDPGKGG